MTDSDSSTWGDVVVEQSETATRRLGPLTLRVRHSEGEVWVAHHSEVEDEESIPDGQAIASWTRWAHRDPTTSVRLVPAFPDRLVVVSPEIPFHLAPGARARIYVRIPLWARVVAVEDESVLIETPTVVLSDTWWGDLTGGELGYWLPTRARRQMTDALFLPHLAVCPLSLSNLSSQVLPVERFALRVAHLSLYQAGTRLWGAETRVVYEMDEEGSRIDITESPPPEAQEVELMCPPREPPPRGFRALTFLRLKL